MSGAAVTSFFLALVWLAMAITAAVIVGTVIEEEGDPGPERDEVHAAVMALIWTIGIVFMLGYAAAGVGLSLEQPWGKAMAWIMIPWTLLLPPGLGTGIAIYQMMVLPKHP